MEVSDVTSLAPPAELSSNQPIERAAAMTYWELESSVRRFQRLMENLGVETALRKAGIQEGDTVFIGEDYELEWED